MLDIRLIRERPEEVAAALARRGAGYDLGPILELDALVRRLTAEVDRLRAEQKRGSRRVALARGEEREALVAEMRSLGDRIKEVENRRDEAALHLRDLLSRLPNLPDPEAPEGSSEEENKVLKVVGEAAPSEGSPDHLEIGLALGLIDVERASRASGTRFAYLMKEAVFLEFALVRYALDKLVPHGFIPVVPPVLVREEAMFGTGFLPTDESNLYRVEPDGLYLVGTSEVSLAAMHAGEILRAEDLPLRYVGFSTCFRREAGAWGKDTRGIFRVHQFDKVEMFSFCHPSLSREEHAFLVEREEEIFSGLGIPYRVVDVCTGELGAAAARKIDLEAWLPGQGRYREITSCSNCTDYQARRLGVRFRSGKGTEFVHTLNGTAVAIGRTIIAILENYRRPDGSVEVPSALRPYMPGGMEKIGPGS